MGFAASRPKPRILPQRLMQKRLSQTVHQDGVASAARDPHTPILKAGWPKIAPHEQHRRRKPRPQGPAARRRRPASHRQHRATAQQRTTPKAKGAAMASPRPPLAEPPPSPGQDDTEAWRAKFVHFYQTNAPSKAKFVNDKMMAKWKGRYKELYSNLERKYGPDGHPRLHLDRRRGPVLEAVWRQRRKER